MLCAPKNSPQLQALVIEASQALARLDADRLEELALCCQALNRELTPIPHQRRAELADQSRRAAAGMALLARVLEATRANLNVMSRLRDLRRAPLEYRPGQEPQRIGTWSARQTEIGHGNN
jgi:ABC-type transporter Mla subunit MlaD